MPRPFRSLSPGDSAVQTVRRWITGTFTGRALLTGALIKLVAALLRVLRPESAIVESVDTAGDLALIAGAVLLAYGVFAEGRELFLWRVRSKLTVSYIFIGVVPVLLVIVLFLTTGALLFLNVSQYVARESVRAVVDQAAFLAESAAVGLQSRNAAELRERLMRRQAGAVKAFPYVSYAVVPASRTCPALSGDPAFAPGEVIAAGAWRHMDPPRAVPEWVTCAGTAGLIAYTAPVRGPDGDTSERSFLAARAVAWPDDPEPNFAVIVDVPFSAALDERVRRATGIEVDAVTIVRTSGCDPRVLRGRELDPGSGAELEREASRIWNPLRQPRPYVAFLQYSDWRTGDTCSVSMRIVMTVADLYARISSSPGSEGTAGRALFFGIGVVGALLLVIQMAAFIMGLTLARSITGSVHELFEGTERVRHGDFTHKIAIRSRDQLGALAQSFNSMTASVEDLLQAKAEKERMEQELRIARNIQMSLLPQSSVSIAGLLLAAHCEPAREVGGDYYDYLPIDDHRVGLLIADVAGKGTSAALYMAELKGLMLSLSQLQTSPRRLLIDANRIISKHLDSRSFITITYAVVDMQARTLTYARAGHTPLIYVPGPQAPSRAAQILAPDGLVLGLQIDDGQRFEGLLQEETIPLGPGDLFLFYTDGLTEAMDPEGNCFGEARLGALMREHADLPFEELRERILREIAAFSGSADQQDDMTMLLLKVDVAAMDGPADAYAAPVKAGVQA